MPGNRDHERRDETPRTDLPPEREPYDEGYFGTPSAQANDGAPSGEPTSTPK